MNEERDSVYKRCSEYIVIQEEVGKPYIRADRIATNIHDGIDLSEMSREELELRYIKSQVAVCLNDHGYRSIIHGFGYYTNPSIKTNPLVLKQLVNNAEMQTKVDKEVFERLIKTAQEHPQMYVDPDGTWKCPPSRDELLEILESNS